MNEELENRIKKIFGETLIHFRQSKNMSQEKLYLKSGLDRKFIVQIEKGRQTPSLISITKIINALEISFLEFFELFESKLNKL